MTYFRNCALTLAGLLLLVQPATPNTAVPATTNTPVLLTDFTSSSPDFGWYVLNDGVMGGRSVGDFESSPGELHFTGRTNTNGGGFSSIRTDKLALDLSQHTGIRLRIKADGRRYTWRITTDARWRGRQVSYWAEFDSTAGEWQDVEIPFAAFVPRFRGYQLDGPPLDPASITGMGLMIYDKQDGPFDIRMASVSSYPSDSD